MDQKYNSYDDLFANNQDWVKSKLAEDQDYFINLSKGQKPPFLFISCCDSRQLVTQITQTTPGELFIHRNIANQVSIRDLNVLSVLEYAIMHLKVSDIIICGHYGCGGINAILDSIKCDLLSNWLMPIKELYFQNQKELDNILDPVKKSDRLSEINVVAQVRNVCKSSIMQKAIEKGSYPKVHGWIFDIYTGSIIDLPLPINMWKEQNLLPEDYTS